MKKFLDRIGFTPITLGKSKPKKDPKSDLKRVIEEKAKNPQKSMEGEIKKVLKGGEDLK